MQREMHRNSHFLFASPRGGGVTGEATYMRVHLNVR